MKQYSGEGIVAIFGSRSKRVFSFRIRLFQPFSISLDGLYGPLILYILPYSIHRVFVNVLYGIVNLRALKLGQCA